MGANAFDLMVILLLSWSAYKGFSKGIILSAASLIALLLGVWGAVKFSDITASYLTGVINVDEKVLGVIAFAITFILIVIAVHFIAKAVEGLAEAVALSIVNKVFGAAFGALKFAFIISVILVVLNAANRNLDFLSPEFKQKSLFYKPIASFAPSLFKYLDFEEIKEEVQSKTGGIEV
ncbi:MAG: CvpA family protein [Salinivirgaceae bacterium]|jgi:membrane protein required for colicin V production|nr:CvpA family protein [Salinivirgaceae bacterium]